MIRITPEISIDESLVRVEFVRSDGPGGQNINKVATAVQLRFDVAACQTLSDDVKQRLAVLAGRRMTVSGEIVIDARRHRTQARNRDDALDRLIDLIGRAAHRPKTRRKTRPSLASKRKRLETKHHRATIKTLRKKPAREE